MSKVSRLKFKHEIFMCAVLRSVWNPSHDEAPTHLSCMSTGNTEHNECAYKWSLFSSRERIDPTRMVTAAHTHS